MFWRISNTANSSAFYQIGTRTPGAISLYYPNRLLQPRKTGVFTEHLIDHFRRERLAERFAGNA